MGTKTGNRISPGQGAPAQTEMPRGCANLQLGFPACPGAQLNQLFKIRKYQIRGGMWKSQRRARPYPKATVGNGHRHGHGKRISQKNLEEAKTLCV